MSIVRGDADDSSWRAAYARALEEGERRAWQHLRDLETDPAVQRQVEAELSRHLGPGFSMGMVLPVEPQSEEGTGESG